MIEIGIDSEVLRKIRDGQKTIEGRLARGKFLTIRVGDLVSVREDFYVDGVIVQSQEGALRIQIDAAEKFANFRAMLQSVGFEKAIPDANNLDDACDRYLRFYSETSQKEFGVLAIFFHVVSS